MKHRRRFLRFAFAFVALVVAVRLLALVPSVQDELAQRMSAAAYKRKTSGVVFWLVLGASPNRMIGGQSPAIHTAASKDDISTLKLLLLCGADPNLKAKFGITPLWEAERSGAQKAATLLRSHRGYAAIDPGAP